MTPAAAAAATERRVACVLCVRMYSIVDVAHVRLSVFWTVCGCGASRLMAVDVRSVLLQLLGTCVCVCVC